MNAEVLAIGTELLMGDTVDTNGAWLSNQLVGLGLEVHHSQRVDDTLDLVVRCLRDALGRSDIVVTTGGLGPTVDDLTREAVAEVVGEEPRVDPTLEAELRAIFARFGRPMPAGNVKQAWLIPSAESLPNRAGTAPGWLVRHLGRIIVCLPGPPSEMRPMWMEQVVPRLPGASTVIHRRSVKLQGLGESSVAEMLGDLVQSVNPTVNTYVGDDGIHVRLVARARTPEEAREIMDPVVAQVHDVLGERIWGEDDDSLARLVAARLEARGASLCTVESVTGGLVASELSAVPGVSAVFRGGVVAYRPEAKIALGVSGEILEAHGQVSDETALAMARAAARFLGADYAVATTGVAGPSPLEEIPPGRVHVAVRGPSGEAARRFDFVRRPRGDVQRRATFSALFMLLEMLRA